MAPPRETDASGGCAPDAARDYVEISVKISVEISVSSSVVRPSSRPSIATGPRGGTRTVRSGMVPVEVESIPLRWEKDR